MWELFTKLQIAPLRGAKKLALFLALAKFPFRLQSCFPTIVIYFPLKLSSQRIKAETCTTVAGEEGNATHGTVCNILNEPKHVIMHHRCS